MQIKDEELTQEDVGSILALVPPSCVLVVSSTSSPDPMWIVSKRIQAGNLNALKLILECFIHQDSAYINVSYTDDLQVNFTSDSTKGIN